MRYKLGETFCSNWRKTGVNRPQLGPLKLPQDSVRPSKDTAIRYKLLICWCPKEFDLIWPPHSSALWPWLCINKSASSLNEMWLDVRVNIYCISPARAYLDFGILTHPPLVQSLEWIAPPMAAAAEAVHWWFSPSLLKAHITCTILICAFSCITVSLFFYYSYPLGTEYRCMSFFCHRWSLM